MQQKRLIIALLISTAILFAWNFLAPVPPKPATPASTPSPQSTSPQQSPTPSTSAVSTPSPGSANSPSPKVNDAPHRTVLIRTPLYEAKLDSLGAEAISWIIKKNKD